MNMKYLFFFLLTTGLAAQNQLILKPKIRHSSFESYGKIKPQRKSKVASKISGQVTGRFVEIGQFVDKGQDLFKLNAGTLPFETNLIELEISKQQLQLTYHQNRYDRRIKNPDAYTEEGLDLEKLQIDRIKLEIEKLVNKKAILKLKLDDKKVKAPFDGVITALFVETGDWVMLGGPTAAIQSTGIWRLETEVPWQVYTQLQIGDIVWVSKSSMKQKAEIIAKVPVSNPKTGQFRLEIGFKSKNWNPSQLEIVPVIFAVKKKQLEIPMKYVKKELGTYQVKTVEENGSRWLAVEGISKGDFFYPNGLDLQNFTLQSPF